MGTDVRGANTKKAKGMRPSYLGLLLRVGTIPWQVEVSIWEEDRGGRDPNMVVMRRALWASAGWSDDEGRPKDGKDNRAHISRIP